MLRLLSKQEVNHFTCRGANPYSDRGRYFGIEDTAIARLIKRGWVISEIRDFFVISEKRRQGYGRRLLQLLLQEVQTPVVFLTVRQENAPMRCLVESEGFRNIETIISPIGNEVVFYAKRGL